MDRDDLEAGDAGRESPEGDESAAARTARIAAQLSPVLCRVRYPAGTWELTMTAETYGADVSTRSTLRRLPGRTYRSVHEVMSEIVGGDLYVGPPTSTQRVFSRTPEVVRGRPAL